MNQSLSDIVIFQSEDGATHLAIKLEKETIWLSQKQMSELFEKDTDTIGLHLKNIYSSGELAEERTTEDLSVVQTEGKRRVKRRVKFYNLDAVISVGYRVNSKRGTQFRIWATNVLKDHLIRGYSINQNRLTELKQTIQILTRASQTKELEKEEVQGLFAILSDFSLALDILDDYDHQRLTNDKTHDNTIYEIQYGEAIFAVRALKEKFGGSGLFGNEKDESFKSSIASINQTFDGEDLYKSVEEKAANLLYFVVKNHSFSDGNKRIAAWLFVWYLEKNKLLYREDGSKRIADNALVALTLMIAESKPEEKDLMIKVVINLINTRNE